MRTSTCPGILASRALWASVLTCGTVLAAAPPPADLNAERFGPPVAKPSRNAPLRSTLEDVSAAAGVKLTAANDLSSARVSLVGPPRPLREVLRALAWPPGASWLGSPDASGIRLERTTADRNRLDAERAGRAREGRLRLQRRWAQVEHWLSLDEEGLSELARLEPAMASVLRDQRSRGMKVVAFRLPPSFRNALFLGQTPGAPLQSLPTEATALMTPSLAGFGRRDLDAGAFFREGRFQLEVSGPIDRLTVWFDVGTPSEQLSTNLLYAEGWTRQPPAERRAAILAHPTPAPRTAVFRRRVSLRDPQGAGSARLAERPADALPLLPLVEQLSRECGATFVVQTDFQPRPEDQAAGKVDPRAVQRWLGTQWWLGEAIVDQPLPVALDLLCADFDYEWTTRGNVIVLRHRRWYLPEEERTRGKPRTPLFPRRPRPPRAPQPPGPG